jgi:hypothetical protein
MHAHCRHRRSIGSDADLMLINPLAAWHAGVPFSLIALLWDMEKSLSI